MTREQRVLEKVSELRDIPVSDILGKSREAEIVQARRECIYLLRRYLGCNKETIASMFRIKQVRWIHDTARKVQQDCFGDYVYRQELYNSIKHLLEQEKIAA